MKPSLIEKLKTLTYRYSEIGGLLSDSTVINDQDRYRELGKEYAQLEPIVKCFQQFQQNEKAIESAEEMQQEKDPELRKLAEEELEQLTLKKEELEDQLKLLLVPKDPNDERNVFLKFAPAQAATRRLFLPAIYSECMRDTLKQKDGE